MFKILSCTSSYQNIHLKKILLDQKNNKSFYRRRRVNRTRWFEGGVNILKPPRDFRSEPEIIGFEPSDFIKVKKIKFITFLMIWVFI